VRGETLESRRSKEKTKGKKTCAASNMFNINEKVGDITRLEKGARSKEKTILVKLGPDLASKKKETHRLPIG